MILRGRILTENNRKENECSPVEIRGLFEVANETFRVNPYCI
jgi:hypothetical protein